MLSTISSSAASAVQRRSAMDPSYGPVSARRSHETPGATLGRRARGARGPAMPLPRERLELVLRPCRAISRPFFGATPLLRPSPTNPCGRSYQSEDLGRRAKAVFDPGRQPGQGALVVRALRASARARRADVRTRPRRTACRPSLGVAHKSRSPAAATPPTTARITTTATETPTPMPIRRRLLRSCSSFSGAIGTCGSSGTAKGAPETGST